MKRLLPLLFAALAISATPGARAEVVTLQPRTITEWKAVFGEIEARDNIPARTRIGGTIVTLNVTEGDTVTTGQKLALVEDSKLAFQLDAMDAQLAALRSRLATSQADLARGAELIKRGVITTQRLGQLSTATAVLQGQIKSAEAQRLVVVQQVSEGEVLAPEAGLVLSVPLSKGSVVNPGEAVAVIGGGGMFLRLSVPERHATSLVEGDMIEIGAARDGKPRKGKLVKIYPEIIGGRVQADVEVPGLDSRFVGRRVLVRLPVGTRQALLVPPAAVTLLDGIDFVTVESGEKGQETVRRAVVPGQIVQWDGKTWREILTGLVAGERVVTDGGDGQ